MFPDDKVLLRFYNFEAGVFMQGESRMSGIPSLIIRVIFATAIIHACTGCHESENEWRTNRNRIWLSQRELFFQISIRCETPRKKKYESVNEILSEIRDELGEKCLRCPVCGNPYKVNPNLSAWKEANRDAREIGVLCTTKAHKEFVGMELSGKGVSPIELPTWAK